MQSSFPTTSDWDRPRQVNNQSELVILVLVYVTGYQPIRDKYFLIRSVHEFKWSYITIFIRQVDIKEVEKSSELFLGDSPTEQFATIIVFEKGIQHSDTSPCYSAENLLYMSFLFFTQDVHRLGEVSSFGSVHRRCWVFLQMGHVEGCGG
eukprot:sb/3473528/